MIVRAILDVLLKRGMGMYSFNARIRYSEVGEDQQLTVPGVVNYLQDCSTFQSEDLGMGVRYLSEHNRAWWLTSWQIIIDRYPILGERIVYLTSSVVVALTVVPRASYG